jgi:hypothetical protein
MGNRTHDVSKKEESKFLLVAIAKRVADTNTLGHYTVINNLL